METHGDMDAGAVRATVDLITAAWRTQAVYAAARLGLPDLIAAGHTDSAALAAAAGGADGKDAPDAGVVRRLLRVLVLLGVVEGTEETGYRNTATGELLRDRPGSLRDVCLLYGEEFYQAWGHAAQTFRTGRPGFEAAYGQSLIAYLRDDPKAAGRFQRAMQASNFFFDSVPQEIDFTGSSHIVDIAGGSGQLLSTVLRAAPQARGTLFDLEHTIPIAREHLAATVGTDRVDLVAGDMFTGRLPEGADTYLLSRVLGDWPDAECVQVLRNIRSSMAAGSRLLVVERVVRDDRDGLLAPLWDLHLLVLNGGTQRTLDTYHDLAARSGLHVARLVELPMENTALVLTPTA
ncbi:methyltransferase [Streptomyces gamaensis]|uniref:Methyltransferase n=1 Tax=Streptomyces gamaensis TaxID=1763542 RepID=A0ABW0Z1K2_9ACTN